MRSRNPETRATISTRRELSIWATKLSVFGIVAVATVVSVTWGAGRSGGGASFEQPAAAAATRTARRIGIFPMGTDRPIAGRGELWDQGPMPRSECGGYRRADVISLARPRPQRTRCGHLSLPASPGRRRLEAHPAG